MSLNSEAFGLALLIVVATTISIALHAMSARYWRMCALAALAAGIVWMGFSLLIGAVDALIGVAWFFATFWAFVMSCLVGIPFRLRRRNTAQ